MPRVEMIESFSALKERFEQDHQREAMKKMEEVD